MKVILSLFMTSLLLVGCSSKPEEVKAINDTLGEGHHNIKFDTAENMVIESRFENPPQVTGAIQLYQLAYDEQHSSIISDHEAGKGLVNVDGTFKLILPKQTVFGGFYMANPGASCSGTHTENLLDVAYHTVLNYRVNGKSYVVLLTTQNPFNPSFTPGKKDYQFVYVPKDTQLKAEWGCNLGTPTSLVIMDAILKPGWNILEKEFLGVDAADQRAKYTIRRVNVLPRDARFFIKP